MSLGRYSILVLGIVAATLGLAWPLVLRRLDAPGRGAVVLGAAIAVLNTTAAHALARWSLARPLRAFLRAVLGGMAARMAFMLGALLAAILLLGLPSLPLVFSLLSYFVVFLALEIVILHRQTLTSLRAVR